MSLNTAIFDDNGQLTLKAQEKVFFQQEKIRMEYGSGSGYPGEGHCFFSKDGRLLLTNQRIVYEASPHQILLKNMEIPLENLTEGQLFQPWFDVERYEGTIVPQSHGGLTTMGAVKWFFPNKEGFEFSSIFLQLKSRISQENTPWEEAGPPQYTAPPDYSI